MAKPLLDVLIVGAGPGGLTAALALRRHGLNCEIVERVDQDRLCSDVGGGYHIGSSTLAMLDRLNAGASCRNLGVRFESLHARTDRGELIRNLEIPRNVDQVTLRRSMLQKILLTELGDKTPLRLGCEVTGLAQEDDRVRAVLASGEKLSARVLIGADGVQSKVRESILRDGAPRFCGLTCCWGRLGIADVTVEKFSPQLAYTQLGPGATLAATNVGKEIIWSATWRTPVFERSVGPDARKRRVAERFAMWSSPAPQLIGATSPDVIAEVGIWDRDPAPRWTLDRVALIGDAAHPMTPFLGQGANSAMLDAYVLADCLARLPHDQAFRAYERRRKSLVNRSVMKARQFADYTTVEVPWKRAAMNGLLRYLPAPLIVNSMLRADVKSDISDLFR